MRLPAGRGLTAYVCQCPALRLGEDKTAALVADMRQVAQSVLGDAALDYGVFDPRASALEYSLVTILYEGKKPVAFNALPIAEVEVGTVVEPVLHLGLVMVDPSARSKGLSSMLYGFSCVLFFLKNQMRPVWVSSVTQVPAVVGLVAELYSDTYPGLAGSRLSFYQKLLGQGLMTRHRHIFGVGEDADFDQNHFIIRNAYTGGSDALKKTYDTAAKHRITAYNDMCRTQLDYDRGDDFLQIGLLDGRAVQNYLLRMIPDGNLLRVLCALVFFVFNALLLPVLYWFDNKRKWGGLRPFQ